MVWVIPRRQNSICSHSRRIIWPGRPRLWCSTGFSGGTISFYSFQCSATGYYRVTWHQFCYLRRWYPIIFLTFPPKDRLQAIKKIEACIADIRSWCQSNKSALNDSKTELIYCSSKFVESSWEPSIKIGDATILPSARARNLGVIMDSTLSMGDHVNNVCKGALAGIRKIGQIRSYLTEDATAKLVHHAFVTSRLDSCNSLLFGLPDHDIRKVQMVQNTAARLVLRVSWREHITPSLEKLHWLPVQQRSYFLHTKPWMVWHLSLFQILFIYMHQPEPWDLLRNIAWLYHPQQRSFTVTDPLLTQLLVCGTTF